MPSDVSLPRVEVGVVATAEIKPRDQPGVPRLAFSRREAAAALGVSTDSFERHIQPELRCIRRGRLRLFDLRELQRWLDENSARTLG